MYTAPEIVGLTTAFSQAWFSKMRPSEGAKGLSSSFPPPKYQTVTIGYRVGAKIVRVDADGGITLPIDQGSLAENPTITFSEKPLKASVDL